MEFGWINLFGAGIVILMMVPNIVYAIRNKDEKNLCTNRFMNILEQLGRYGCIVLIWLPLLVWKFGFSSDSLMLIDVLGNVILLAAYIIVFAKHLRKKSTASSLTLAILPACIFLLSGLTLRHWPLAGFAVLFAIGHIFVIWKNIEKK